MKTIIPIKTNDRLLELESVIQRGQESFLEVGRALAEIRDKKLYRANHRTFEAYCRDRWGFTEQRGFELIYSHDTVMSLPPEMRPLIKNSWQAEAIKAAPESMRPEILQRAAESGKITASTIRDAIEESADTTPMDLKNTRNEIGILIQTIIDRCRDVVKRRPFARNLLVRELRKAANRIQTDETTSHSASVTLSKARNVARRCKKTRN